MLVGFILYNLMFSLMKEDSSFFVVHWYQNVYDKIGISRQMNNELFGNDTAVLRGRVAALYQECLTNSLRSYLPFCSSYGWF